MQYCLSPIPIGYVVGLPPGISPVHGVRKYTHVSCGGCKACRANRKQDWSGRLLAESYYSSKVVFSTFTYKEEPERFRYSDIQTMLRKVRDHYQKKDPSFAVRFFAVGEKGERFNRRHWHMMWFFPHRAPAWERWGKETNPGELWKFWPHGWSDIQPLSSGEYLTKARYCAKYCLKDAKDNERYPCKSSLRPAIGDEYFRHLAKAMAFNGIVPDGKYRFPDVRWTKGRKKGELIDFSITGSSRVNFISYWRAAWRQRYPDREPPSNQWLAQWDDDGCVYDDAVINRLCHVA